MQAILSEERGLLANAMEVCHTYILFIHAGSF